MIWTVNTHYSISSRKEAGECVSCQFGHRISNTILNATSISGSVPYQSSRQGPGRLLTGAENNILLRVYIHEILNQLWLSP